MSRQTSRGVATVRQLCVAFVITPQAFYKARGTVRRLPVARRWWRSAEKGQRGTLKRDHPQSTVIGLWVQVRWLDRFTWGPSPCAEAALHGPA